MMAVQDLVGSRTVGDTYRTMLDSQWITHGEISIYISPLERFSFLQTQQEVRRSLQSEISHLTRQLSLLEGLPPIPVLVETQNFGIFLPHCYQD